MFVEIGPNPRHQPQRGGYIFQNVANMAAPLGLKWALCSNFYKHGRPAGAEMGFMFQFLQTWPPRWG